jgi:hypothetical protein
MNRETREPRTRCRLPCTIRVGRGRARARVLDISSGGLCFIAPVCFRESARVHVEIVVPRRGVVAVEGEVRHRRPFRQPSSGRRGWATGLALATPGPEYLALTSPGALAESSAPAVVESLERSSTTSALDTPHEELQSLYRVRLKAADSSRTRTLTLRAVSESAVCEAVLGDLPGDWVVLAVEVDPID